MTRFNNDKGAQYRPIESTGSKTRHLIALSFALMATMTCGSAAQAADNMPAMAKYQFTCEVEPQYLAEQSAPDEEVYAFAYTITITNTGDVTAQLIAPVFDINSDPRANKVVLDLNDGYVEPASGDPRHTVFVGQVGKVHVIFGEGLETQLWRIDDEDVKWIGLDLPEVIELREEMLPSDPRQRNIAASVLDESWMAEIDARDGSWRRA